MNDCEETDKHEEAEEKNNKGVAKEILTHAQRAKLKIVCDQLGRKYRTPEDSMPETELMKVVLDKKTKDDGQVVRQPERNGDNQR